jgi:tetratricopeptide (TPR) repeat protein
MALVRKELVRPDRAQLPGDDAFRFRHLLIRDAAYDGLPKAARAELHERFAAWLETHGMALIELDEILGYHLEQAYRYRVELGLGGEQTVELARQASRHLGAAGERAFIRFDDTAAVALLSRALALLPLDERPIDLVVMLTRARFHVGEIAAALAELEELVTRARETGDRGRELRGRLAHAWMGHFGAHLDVAEVSALVDESLSYFGERGDDAGLAETWAIIAAAEHNALRSRAMAEAIERTIEYGERAGSTATVRDARLWLYAPFLYGPFSVEEAIAFYDAHPSPMPLVTALRGGLEATRGDVAAGRELVARARDHARELGQLTVLGAVEMQEVEIALASGDLGLAVEAGLRGVEILERAGETGWLSTLAAETAHGLYGLGRDDEALGLAERGEQAGAEDDVMTLMLVRQVRAKVLARRGELVEAERLAREALSLSPGSEAPVHHGDALVDLGIVLAAAGKRDDALAALDEARSVYESKGYVLGIARTEKLRSELGATLEA